ncbi:MAG: NUDIX hydrolase [Desulfobacteraceae bacterium]
MEHRNPYLTVDIIIECRSGIVLIERKNPPLGWALPGGFVDYGETLETAAVREAKEETSMNVHLKEQMHTYSDPARDPRHHTVSTVFIATAEGSPTARDDAKNAGIFSADTLPSPIVFDHLQILTDYFAYKNGEARENVFGISAAKDPNHEGRPCQADKPAVQ